MKYGVLLLLVGLLAYSPIRAEEDDEAHDDHHHTKLFHIDCQFGGSADEAIQKVHADFHKGSDGTLKVPKHTMEHTILDVRSLTVVPTPGDARGAFEACAPMTLTETAPKK